jgi:peptidoglycan/LPS O-acetylase OafA/YrhL
MDGLRGLLAVYVMCGHALPFTTLPAWAIAPFGHGEAAVDLFFCLSGFVIPASLAHHQRAWRFLRARARRLLPVYLSVLAVSTGLLFAGDPLAAMPWVGSAGRDIWAPGLPAHPLAQLAAHVTLTQGLIPAGLLPFAYVTLLGPAWSLSTEAQFYVGLAWLGAGRQRLAIALLIALAAAWALAPEGGGFAMSRAFLPAAAAYFALGLASAVWLNGGARAPFALCLAAALLLAGSPAKMLLPLAWVAVLCLQTGKRGALLESPVLLALGALSYPLYLVNEPVQRALALLIAPHAGAHFTALWLPPALALPVLAAAALHAGLERPLARAGYHRHPPAPLPSARNHPI